MRRPEAPVWELDHRAALTSSAMRRSGWRTFAPVLLLNEGIEMRVQLSVGAGVSKELLAS